MSYGSRSRCKERQITPCGICPLMFKCPYEEDEDKYNHRKKVKRMKHRLKMIWRIIRDKQVVVITEDHGKMYYNWSTRSISDALQMCHKVCELALMMKTEK